MSPYGKTKLNKTKKQQRGYSQISPTHLCKRCALIQAHSYIPLGKRIAPQHRDVQGKEKKSQEQEQFRRQSHHPLDATALWSPRCGRSSDSASSRCRDSNLRIRRGRGAATPLRSHFGNHNCKKNKNKKITKNEGKRSGGGAAKIVERERERVFSLDPVFFLCRCLYCPAWRLSLSLKVHKVWSEDKRGEPTLMCQSVRCSESCRADPACSINAFLSPSSGNLQPRVSPTRWASCFSFPNFHLSRFTHFSSCARSALTGAFSGEP